MNLGGWLALAVADDAPPAGGLEVVDRFKVPQLVADIAIVATNKLFFTVKFIIQNGLVSEQI